MASSSKASIRASETDIRLLMSVLRNNTTNLNASVDWDRVANETGQKPSSVKSRWGQVKKKLGLCAGDGQRAASSTSTIAGKVTKYKPDAKKREAKKLDDTPKDNESVKKE